MKMPSEGAWRGALLLIAITVLAYLPAIRGGFIWDDGAHVTQNAALRSARGLWRIWAHAGPKRGGTTQYYPLTFSVFWVQYHLWGLRPLGYHLVNVLLHAFNAVLVWRLLRRLRVGGALLAAALFSLHPVHVESVAWITELKNVLSGLFYLLALHSYLRFASIAEGTPPEGRARPLSFYLLSVFLFACALASKTAAATLPGAILLILWWREGRVGWRDLLAAAPMLALAAGAGHLTESVERHQVGAAGPEWALRPVERCLLAGRALWFYAGKLTWPSKLTFIYPRWEISQELWSQYLFPLGALAALLGLWALRRKTGRGPLAAVLFFAGTLAPALGFWNVYFMRFSYVADHFQYLASLGPIALFAAGAARIPAKRLLPAVGALLLALGLLTWRQGGIYETSDRIWLDTVEKNPSCWTAHNHLGSAYLKRGRNAQAAEEFLKALELKPDYLAARNNLGLALAHQGRYAEAVAQYEQALRNDRYYAGVHANLGAALAAQGKSAQALKEYKRALEIDPNHAQAHNNLALALARQGKAAQAIAEYKRALRIAPGFAVAHNDLGAALADQGKLAQAAAEFRQAVRIDPDYALAHNNLGVAMAYEGKTDEAIAEFRRALEIEPGYGQAADNLRRALIKRR